MQKLKTKVLSLITAVCMIATSAAPVFAAQSRTTGADSQDSGTVQTPTANPAAGAVAAGTSVTLNCATEGATIYYTTDNSDPTTSSTKYTSAITINEAVTIKAIATKTGMTNSAEATFAYTITEQQQVAAPTANPAAGPVAKGTNVTLSCATEGATIRYTTDGSDPTANSTQYTNAITISEAMTIKAIATKTGMTDSTVAEFAYTITGETTLPVINPTSATFDKADQADVVFTLTPGTTATEITDVAENANAWAKDTAWSFADNKLTLKKDYLKTLAAATYSLTLTYNDNTTGTVSLEVTGSIPLTAKTLSPITMNIGDTSKNNVSDFATGDGIKITNVSFDQDNVVTHVIADDQQSVDFTALTVTDDTTVTATVTVTDSENKTVEATLKITVSAKEVTFHKVTVASSANMETKLFSDASCETEITAEQVVANTGVYVGVKTKDNGYELKSVVANNTELTMNKLVAGGYVTTQNAYSVAADTTFTVTEQAVAAPTATATSNEFDRANTTVTSFTVGTYDLGKGSKAATSVASVSYGSKELSMTASNGTISVNAAALKALNKVGPVALTVKFNNNAVATISITIKDTAKYDPVLTIEGAEFVGTPVYQTTGTPGAGSVYTASFKVKVADNYKVKTVTVNGQTLTATNDTYTASNLGAQTIYNVVVTAEIDTATATEATVTKAAEQAGIKEVAVSKDSAIPDGAEVRVDVVPAPPKAALAETVRSADSNPSKLTVDTSGPAVALDISAIKDGVIESVTGTVKVTMDKPDDLSDNIAAIHTHDGKVEVVKATVVGGKVHFILKGLSEVVLVNYVPTTEKDNQNGGDNNDTYYPPNNNTNNNTNNGASGGGGGGGGGSGSSKSQSIFDKSTSTINGILKNLLTGGKSTVASAGAAATAAQQGKGVPVTQSAASKAVSNAISTAKSAGADSANVIFQNASTISADVLSSIASQAQKAGLKAYVNADTIKNGVVDVRIKFLASAAARLGNNMNLYGKTGNQVVENHFAKYFKNKIAVVELGQKGSFGMTVNVAARVNLSGMDTDNLRFYTFDIATNSYHEIVPSNYFIDVNGYVHFDTSMGNYIIITDQPLTLL